MRAQSGGFVVGFLIWFSIENILSILENLRQIAAKSEQADRSAREKPYTRRAV